ncbi:MAG: protoporphyrinogen/coproporphyrinogen oxidase, partial [Bdellovibrionota bacterium]
VELLPVRATERWVLRRGKLRRYPLGILETIRAFFRAYLVLAPRGRDPEKMSLDEWARRHVGAAARDFLFDPMVRGIYGCRLEELEAGTAFPALVVPRGHSFLSSRLNRWRRGLRGARGKMVAPRNGMGSLAEALEKSLMARLGARFVRGRRVDTLPRESNLVLSVPLAEAARILTRDSPTLGESLNACRSTPLISVGLTAPRTAFQKVPHGVGVLFPSCENRQALGILFNSSAFEGRAGDQDVSLTVMMGGSSRTDLASATDDAILSEVRKELQSLFGFHGELSSSRIYRNIAAVPRYDSLLRQAWSTALETWCASPGHMLFANYTGQVSVRGMIESASALAARLQNPT